MGIIFNNSFSGDKDGWMREANSQIADIMYRIILCTLLVMKKIYAQNLTYLNLYI